MSHPSGPESQPLVPSVPGALQEDAPLANYRLGSLSYWQECATLRLGSLSFPSQDFSFCLVDLNYLGKTIRLNHDTIPFRDTDLEVLCNGTFFFVENLLPLRSYIKNHTNISLFNPHNSFG